MISMERNSLAEISEPVIYQPKSLRALCAESINNKMGARHEPKVRKDLGIDVEAILKVDPVTLPPLMREIRAFPLEEKEGKFKEFSEQCRFQVKPEHSTWESFFSSRAFEPQIRDRINPALALVLDDELRRESNDIGSLINSIQNYPAERKESIYRELAEKCRFTNKAPDVLWETFFNVNAANWIVTNHPESVAAVKTSFEEYQEEHRNIIQNIFFAAVDGLVNYLRDLKVTFQLISSDQMNKCTLGTDVFYL